MAYHLSWRNVPAGQLGYFRLDSFGMVRYCDLMIEFKMAFHDAAPPQWPDAEDFGLTEEEWWAVAYPDDCPNIHLHVAKRARAEKMLAELHTIWTAHTKQVPGIPLHKLRTNNGWIVLPAECNAAVQAWRNYYAKHGQDAAGRVGDADAQAAWQQWLTYLADAAAHNGFVVR